MVFKQRIQEFYNWVNRKVILNPKEKEFMISIIFLVLIVVSYNVPLLNLSKSNAISLIIKYA